MRALAILSLLLASAALAGEIKPDPTLVKAAPVPFPFAEWDALTHKYVDGEGRVNYAAIDKAALEKVYAALAASSPASAPEKYPSRNAKLAYYIDAYNISVWKNVLSRLPGLKNVDKEKASFFFFTKFNLGGKWTNLLDLEKDIIRKQFKDPRIHMAVNCASRGCPKLPAEAFEPAKLDAQLNREAKKFCNEKRNVDYDAASKTVKLSHIFDWYKDDFGKDNDKVIAWINTYRENKIPTDAKIQYVDYDWTLNDI